jgi:hypothetical protein
MKYMYCSMKWYTCIAAWNDIHVLQHEMKYMYCSMKWNTCMYVVRYKWKKEKQMKSTRCRTNAYGRCLCSSGLLFANLYWNIFSVIHSIDLTMYVPSGLIALGENLSYFESIFFIFFNEINKTFTWALNQEIRKNRDQCFDHYFRQLFLIFSKKISIFFL